VTETRITDVVADLAALPPGAVVYEQAMAAYFHRHPMSIKRAVARGELPPPVRLLGRNAWTAGAIVQHLQQRQEQAGRRRAAMDERIAKLCP
jgi:hypothetical protein